MRYDVLSGGLCGLVCPSRTSEGTCDSTVLCEYVAQRSGEQQKWQLLG